MQLSASTGLIERLLTKAGLLKPTVQKDRRNSKRYRLDLPIRFRIFLPSNPDRSSDFVCARLYDLSELGVGLLSNAMEYEGLHIMDPSGEVSESCHLEIEIPYGVKPLKLHGKAVWYLRNPEGHPNAFRIGVQFLKLTPELRKAIQTLIHFYHAGAGVA